MCNCFGKLKLPSPFQMIHGAIEITKTRLGIGVAPRDIILQRVEICKKCPNKNYLYKDSIKYAQCEKCLCLVAEKVQRMDEDCPLKFWDAI